MSGGGSVLDVIGGAVLSPIIDLLSGGEEEKRKREEAPAPPDRAEVAESTLAEQTQAFGRRSRQQRTRTTSGRGATGSAWRRPPAPGSPSTTTRSPARPP